MFWTMKRWTWIAVLGWIACAAVPVEGAVVRWNVDGGGDWRNPYNWDSAPNLPGDSDDVIISRAAGDFLIEHACDSTAVKSLLLNEDLLVASGTLTISETFRANTFDRGVSIKVQGGWPIEPSSGKAAAKLVDSAKEGGSSEDAPVLTAAGPIFIDGCDLYAVDGGVMNMTATGGSYQCSADNYFRATGSGSLLNLEGLNTLAGGRLHLQAYLGGRVEIPNVDAFQTGVLFVEADGGQEFMTESVVDLSALTYLMPSQGGSSIEVRRGGRLLCPNLTTLDHVDLRLDGTGMMDTGQIAAYTNGIARFEGVSPDFSKADNISYSRFEITDALLSLEPEHVDGASFVANGAATVLTVDTDEYAESNNRGYYWADFTANLGATLDLSSFQRLSASANCGNSSGINIEAYDGGRVDLSEIESFNTGQLKIVADGGENFLGSIVDLSRMETLTPSEDWSSITAVNYGEVRASLLTTLNEVDLTFDATGIMDTGQIVTYTKGKASISGCERDFSAARDISYSRFEVADALLSLKPEHVDGASFVANGAATVLTVDTDEYAEPNNRGYYWADFTANLGATLDLSSFQRLSASANCGNSSGINIEAHDGGRVDLSEIESFNTGQLRIVADGWNSIVDLSEMATLTPSEDWSSITAVNYGEVRAPLLTTLNEVDLTLDATGIMDTGQIVTYTNGKASISGRERDFSAARDISYSRLEVTDALLSLNPEDVDGASFVANGAATVLTVDTDEYAEPNNRGYYWADFTANLGATLNLSSFQRLSASANCGNSSGINIEAHDGGRVDLSEIEWFDTGQLRIVADGRHANVDVSVLAVFDPSEDWSTITASREGQITFTKDTLTMGGSTDIVAETGAISAGSLLIDQGADVELTGKLDLTGRDPSASGFNLSKRMLVVHDSGQLTVNGVVEMGPDSCFGAGVGISAQELLVVNGDLSLNGGLSVEALSKLRNAQPGEADWYGDETRTIVAAASIIGTFGQEPSSVPAEPNSDNHGQGHLGNGVFLTDGGPHGQGVVYEPDAVKLDLLQAAPGDTNGDRKVDDADIECILDADLFGRGVHPEADWTTGDFDTDGKVSGYDILTLLGTGLFDLGDYTNGNQPVVSGGESLTELIVSPNGVTLDSNGSTITGYLLLSQAGILTGKAANNLGLFQEDEDSVISGSFDFALCGRQRLGDVVGDLPDGVDLLEDLTLVYTLADATGIFTADVLIAPEIPGDLNGDGLVGSADLDVIRANWGQTANGPAQGDPSGDGIVGSEDLDIVRANWGTSAVAAVVVPEPGAAILIVCCGCIVGLKRRTLV